jgi:hypothetical protein
MWRNRWFYFWLVGSVLWIAIADLLNLVDLAVAEFYFPTGAGPYRRLLEMRPLAEVFLTAGHRAPDRPPFPRAAAVLVQIDR